MSEREFQTYLDALCERLHLSDAQREAIAGELRDHLDARLQDLDHPAPDQDAIIREVLAEFGDATQLAGNLSRSQRPRFAKRLFPVSKRSVALGTVAAALLLFAVYRGGFYAPNLGVNQNELDLWSNESQLVDPSALPLISEAIPDLARHTEYRDRVTMQPVNAEAAHHILSEVVIVDADADTWTALKQLGDISPGDDPTIAVLPDEAWPLVRHLPRTTQIVAPNIMVASGKNATVLVGERHFDLDAADQVKTIHDEGVGIEIGMWWDNIDQTIELALSVHGPRSYRAQDRKPAPRRKTMTDFPAMIESVTLRTKLKHGQILAHRTSLSFSDSPAAHPHRIVLLRVTHVERETQQALAEPRPHDPMPTPAPTLTALR